MRLVASLSIAQRQMVEIAKALSIDARVIIMDEPTSSLTLTETERLLAGDRRTEAHGVSVIYISHRLGEMKSCADRVVVPARRPRSGGAARASEIDHAAMIRLMIGRDLKALVYPARAPPQRGRRAKSVDLVTTAFPGRRIDLSVRRGEILGLAGLVGSGRTSLARALFGIDPAAWAARSGSRGASATIASPAQAIAQGIFLVPEDRKRDGPDPGYADPVENITLASLRRYARLLLVDRRGRSGRSARTQQVRLSIKTPCDRQWMP